MGTFKLSTSAPIRTLLVVRGQVCSGVAIFGIESDPAFVLLDLLMKHQHRRLTAPEVFLYVVTACTYANQRSGPPVT